MHSSRPCARQYSVAPSRTAAPGGFVSPSLSGRRLHQCGRGSRLLPVPLSVAGGVSLRQQSPNSTRRRRAPHRALSLLRSRRRACAFKQRLWAAAQGCEDPRRGASGASEAVPSSRQVNRLLRGVTRGAGGYPGGRFYADPKLSMYAPPRALVAGQRGLCRRRAALLRAELWYTMRATATAGVPTPPRRTPVMSQPC